MIIHFLFLRRSCLFLLFFVDALPPPSSNLALTYYHHKCTKSKQNSYNHFFEFHTWIFENVQVVKHMWSNDLLIQNTSKHWLWLCFKTYEIAAPVSRSRFVVNKKYLDKISKFRQIICLTKISLFRSFQIIYSNIYPVNEYINLLSSVARRWSPAVPTEIWSPQLMQKPRSRRKQEEAGGGWQHLW